MITRERSTLSQAERLIAERKLDAILHRMTRTQRRDLQFRWQFWRRPNQAPPPEFVEALVRIWLVKAGRGYGKTRTGAETVRERIEDTPRIGLIGATAADARDVMVEGESGLLSVFPSDLRPTYEPSKRKVTFRNGATAMLYSADEPERLRGPQHGFLWGDEPASWRFGLRAFDNAMFGLRLGERPTMMLTGTPKPTAWLRDVAKRADCVVTGGSTYENIGNLPEVFIDDVIGRYEGTRLGRQELLAEWLDDVEGALWVEAIIGLYRCDTFDLRDPYTSLNAWLLAQGSPIVTDRRRRWRIHVAVDPPAESAECGIVVAAAPIRGRQGHDHCVVLDDMSMPGRPEQWGAQVVAAWKKWGAEKVVVERNQGGDMTRSTIHAVDPTCPVEKINSDESKADRAEPIAALYERGWIHHVGFFPMLESQMVTWVPTEGKSPDRVDALVHCVRSLLRAEPRRIGQVQSPTSL